MKPAFLIGAAVIAVLGVAAIAYAASGSDDNETAQNNQTPVGETPIPVEPDGGIRTTPDGETPIPVEPNGGIGDTPLPVEPDGGIGDTPSDTPLPVEPDGGIGDTPGDTPVTSPDAPIPSEPPFTVTPAPPQPTLWT